MNTLAFFRNAFLFTLLVFVSVFPQGKVYLVLGSDTAIWDAMDVAKYNCTYNLNLFTAPTSNTAVVMSESFRNPIMDSYGDKLKLTWWIMAGNIFRYAANNNIPVNNTMTLHLMKKYYADKIEQWGDELSLHYHTFAWTDYDNDGKYWWNQSQTFLETKDDFDFTLAQFLLEENVFPVSFRSGWHYMDNDWQNYLNTILPYSLHNDYPNVRHTTTEPIDNNFNWSLASSEFVPFNPAPENYQLQGNSKAWNVRSKYLGQVTTQLVNDLFMKANQGTDQLACFWSHLPDQNFINEIQQANNVIQQVASNYPGVQFKYCTAVEAYQLWLQSNDEVSPDLQLTGLVNGSQVKFQISTNEPIFQSQPFVAVKDRYERYFIAECESISQNIWQTVLSYPLNDIGKAGVAVTDTVGNLSTSFIKYLPDNKFIDNGDPDYSEVFGNWATSSNTAWDLDSRIATILPGDSAKVKWNLETGYTGLHNIFVQFPPVANPVDTIQFNFYKNGLLNNTVKLSLSDQFKQWLYVTTVDINTGENNYIEMYAVNNGASSKTLSADVLKLSTYVRDIELTTNTNFIDLGEVSIEDSVYFSIELSNTGINTLSIQNIYSVLGNITVSANLPLNIAGMSTQQIPLTFIPDEIGSVEDTLVIISNDPINPVYKIPFAALVQEYFEIVDNDNLGAYSETGSWFKSVAQAYGPSSRYANVQSTQNGPAASFTFTLTKDGYYDIYEIVPTTVNAADNAFYKIISNGVVIDSFYLDQNIGSGNWKNFGRYYLNADLPIVIKVIDTGGSTAGRVIRADAFKIALYDETSGTDDNNERTILPEFTLYQNYPNPFNPSTKISWQSPLSGWQSIKLYDALGREVDTIVEGFFNAGTHSKLYVINSSLPSGVYFYKLQAGSFTDTKKMLFLK
ncbi:MAG: T9SS type A sorting domain-containing protein [Ignavibacteriaceae bacterium]